MANEESARKRQRFNKLPITVLVGIDPPEAFYVNEYSLRKYSKFLQAALDIKWEEGQKREIKLLDDSPDVFAAYLTWLHGEPLVLPALSMTDSSGVSYPGTDLSVGLDLYLFGDKIQDDVFCNLVIDKLCRGMDMRFSKKKEAVQFPDVVFMNRLYKNTTENDPIRNLMSTAFASRGQSAWRDIEADQEVNAIFARDLIGILFLRPNNDLRPFYDRRFEFHRSYQINLFR